MFKLFVILLGCVAFSDQQWLSRARLRNPIDYFNNVMQETVYELEKREWCNLKLTDITKNINLQMYDWLVSGRVTYTNGFVISIQNLTITNVDHAFENRVGNETVPWASVRGRLNFHNVIVGYDVTADLDDIGHQIYTGDILLTTIIWEFRIWKNLLANEMAVTASLNSLSGGLIRMNYRPQNNITQVLSRNFIPGDTFSGVASWGPQVFQPIVEDIATNKIDFPEVCFNNC